MSEFIALLRAINVGGTGKLAMTDLSKVCTEAGFDNVKTYIQSGNVVFTSNLAEAKVQTKLDKGLAAHLGKPVAVLLRDAAALDQVLKRNPFKRAAPNQVLVIFLNDAPAKNVLATVEIPAREEVRLIGREVFVHYPDGMGRSKLKLPFAAGGTGRNINTVTKLVALAHGLGNG